MAWGAAGSARVVVLMVAAVVAAVPASAQAARMGSPSVAALQVALRAKGLYSGTIDGSAGPGTRAAVRSLQRHAGISVDGVAGPQTLGALGRRGRPRLGSRAIGPGASGFDVAQLQFLLAWHGFPSGSIDGGYGSHTKAAIIRFQRWARLTRDGIAGAGTIRQLRTAPRDSPVALARPVAGSIGDPFGPRGNKFHPGLDYPASTGTAVFAARSGRVTWAGWWPGGYGNLVSVAHGNGVRAMYAHLSSIAVRRGQRLSTGTLLGRVGSTGLSTGPHLHFELRLRGASIDPATGF
jgi:murein DD-endopeptidase MepM/ murein hydrolase activator NlpD